MAQQSCLLKILLLLLLAAVIAGAAFFLRNPFFKKEGAGEIRSVFNPALLSWQEAAIPAPWPPRDSHGLIAFEDKLWLMAGLNANDYVVGENTVEYWKAPHFSDVWSSEDGINWSLVTDSAPWGKRRSAAVVDFQGKMWLIGGWGPKIGLKNDVWSSENGLNWTKDVSNAAWPAREGHQAVVFKDKLWLIGGVDYDKRETKNDVWYTEDGVNWTEAVSSAPWPSRWDHAVTVFQNKIWLIGGMDLNDNVFNDVWTSENGVNWNLITDNPPWQSRQGHNILAFRGHLWIIGRLNNGQYGGDNDIWFSDNGITWAKTETNPPWSGREDAGTAVFKGKIWEIGGMASSQTWLNDIWYSSFYSSLQPNSETISYPVKTDFLKKLTASVGQSFYPSGKTVEVNIAEQKMRTFENGELVNEFAVSTGKPDNPTPEGNFIVLSKHLMVYSNLAGCWLPFWVGFTSDGLYGFHEVPVCGDGRIGTDDLGEPVSIGCVRIGIEDSEVFYDWVEVGTPIKIYSKTAAEAENAAAKEKNQQEESPQKKPSWLTNLKNWLIYVFTGSGN